MIQNLRQALKPRRLGASYKPRSPPPSLCHLLPKWRKQWLGSYLQTTKRFLIARVLKVYIQLIHNLFMGRQVQLIPHQIGMSACKPTQIPKLCHMHILILHHLKHKHPYTLNTSQWVQLHIPTPVSHLLMLSREGHMTRGKFISTRLAKMYR